MKLYAPEEFWNLSEWAKVRLCNGCGSKGLGGWIVPDTLWGLNITSACDIHDYMYSVGKTEYDKSDADDTFLSNMFLICEEVRYTSWFTRLLNPLRMHRAWIYYLSVCRFGDSAYWTGKVRPE